MSWKAKVPALNDTVAGHVQMSFSVIPACIALVKAGKVKALGVTSVKRTALVPICLRSPQACPATNS
ncbi:MAG TPA: tripartite tricarboxylate transporter substrate-binding protein [Burkholderiales bacterium]|nr:tripartite tricarboxylate transporter substrate-binding protein [Burkholderiales bacterium]